MKNKCLKQDWSNFSHSVSAHIAVTAPSQHSKVWSCQAMAACQRGLRATRMWYWLAPNEMSNYVGQRPILFAEPRTELTKGDIYKSSCNYNLTLGNFFWRPLTIAFMPAPTILFIAFDASGLHFRSRVNRFTFFCKLVDCTKFWISCQW